MEPSLRPPKHGWSLRILKASKLARRAGKRKSVVSVGNRTDRLCAVWYISTWQQSPIRRLHRRSANGAVALCSRSTPFWTRVPESNSVLLNANAASVPSATRASQSNLDFECDPFWNSVGVPNITRGLPMTRHPFAGDADRVRSAANCRRGAERCRTYAAQSLECREEDAWLELASDWTTLAEAFEDEDRLLLN